MNTGLLEQIRQATTLQEIETLLSRGKSFKQADRKTRRKWERAARERWRELLRE